MKETLANHGSIENYLLTSKLHFPTYSPTDTPSVFLLPNDFPYAIEEGICHLLIWSQTPLENAHIEDILENSYGKELWEWVYWVNPPEIQSVRRLPHVHVFLRQRLYGCM
ncbi:hypothetical protein BDF14DRAFT_1719045 [Spinellus fusiger]|nr:hypothetical protein BDF14DRAFT_1719045 [Spinellus fusiger]